MEGLPHPKPSEGRKNNSKDSASPQKDHINEDNAQGSSSNKDDNIDNDNDIDNSNDNDNNNNNK